MQDYTIVFGLTGLYFFIILFFVVFARYKSTKSFLPDLSEFFLAGKSLSPIVLILTLLASLFSTFAVLGLPGLVYAHGIAASVFIALAYVFLTILLFYIGKKLRRYSEGMSIFSPIEVITDSFNAPKLGALMAILFCVWLMPYISLQLVGVGVFVDSYTDGQVTYLTGVGAMMFIVAIYLIAGGMRAVAYTDVVQFIAMAVGLCLGLTFVLHQNELSLMDVWNNVKSNSPEHTAIPGAKGYFTFPMMWSSALILMGIFIQPHVLTRTMMARSDSDTNYLVIGLIAGATFIVLMSMFFGFVAFDLYGDQVKPNFIMGQIFQNLSSIGTAGIIISGLMLMGVLGAAMSTADSLLISIGQVTTRDVVRPFFKMEHKKQVVLSKVIMISVLGCAFVMGLNPPKYMTDMAVYSGAGCAVMLPMFLSFEWEKRSTLAAYISVVFSSLFLIVTVYLKMAENITLFGMHPGTLPFIASFALYFGFCFVLNWKKVSRQS
jgi:SSS family solute:Na+ symporter